MSPDLALLKADLSRDEGRIPHAYTDSEGFLTIGVGHLIDKRRGGRLSEEMIDALLLEDINGVFIDLDNYLPWWRGLSEARQRALANMAFNLGIHGLLKFKKMLAAMQAGDWQEAAKEALASKWASQVGARANRISELLKGD